MKQARHADLLVCRSGQVAHNMVFHFFHIFPLGSAMRVLVATFLDSPSAKARILSAVRRLIYQDKTPLQAIAVHGLFVKVENQKCGIPSGLVD